MIPPVPHKRGREKGGREGGRRGEVALWLSGEGRRVEALDPTLTER